jgi:carboxyl-terminal processing protease
MSGTSKIIIIAAIIIAVVIGFGAGFISSQAVSGVGVFHINQPTPTNNPTQANINLINEVWKHLAKEYVEPDKLSSDNLSASAIRGILAALNDPHMAYLTASDFKFLQSQFSGSFEGIGAVLGQNNNQLTIMSVMKGAPAEASGILAGDIIKKINGESTEGMSVDIAVSKIRGPANTKVTLSILHLNAAEPVDITITRAQVDLASVNLEMKGDIAVITISQFTSRTEDELAKVLPQLKQNNAQGIILDLRDNPGGILDIVIQVTSHFIPNGVIVSVRSNQGVVETYKAEKQNITTDLPMVVLVNANSASGSEVLSGALQDHHRALVAGTTTYGKGSVNVLQPLSDGSGIYITISRWLTPDGRLIEGKGIEPDITLTTTGDAELQWAIDYLHGTPNKTK